VAEFKDVAPGIGGGCCALLALLLSCIGFGLAYNFYDDAESAERYAQEDRMSGRGGWGLGPDFWERRADEHETNGNISVGGGVCFLFVALIAIVGVAVFYSKKKKAPTPPPQGGFGGPGGPQQGPPQGGYGGGTPPPGGYGGPPAGGQPPQGGFGGGTPPPGQGPQGGGFG